MYRLINAIRMLTRENLPFHGWTQTEAKEMQTHLDEVLLPSIDNMLLAIYDAAGRDSAMKVLKTHLVAVHATDRFWDLGGLMVRL